MRRLPLYNELWQESLKRDDFTIISVAGDDRDTVPRLRQVLKDNDVRFPVLHYLDGDEGGQFEYDVSYYGYDMLIDRQGVIVDNIWVREDFIDVIEYLDEHAAEVPHIAIDMSEEQNDDGSFTTNIIVSRSDHQPVEVWLGGWYDFQDSECEREYLFGSGDGEDDEYETRLVEFGEFGDCSFEFSFPARDNVRRFYVACIVDLPGTEPLYDGEWLTIISDRNFWFDEDGVLLDD